MPPETKTPSNAEIDQALKEFEAKSGGQPIQKVSEIPQNEISGISFETDSYKNVKFVEETDIPKMVQLVIKYSGGMIKGQKQAEYVLLGIVVLMLAVSFYLFFG